MAGNLENLLRDSSAALKHSPYLMYCLVFCAPCALHMCRSLRFSDVS